GYGSYGITITPFFAPTFLPWLDHGGIIAIAHVRGGGWYGDAWHKAGMKATKITPCSISSRPANIWSIIRPANIWSIITTRRLRIWPARAVRPAASRSAVRWPGGPICSPPRSTATAIPMPCACSSARTDRPTKSSSAMC
ncbi:MAG: S9 family peptidase, partial [Proteobacteria bacterium]|nr:S9 family peptidase [Pseudomonadota bacterium]